VLRGITTGKTLPSGTPPPAGSRGALRHEAARASKMARWR
jgi:hypothetical protein